MRLTAAPFDARLNGDDAALSDAAKAGLAPFLEKGCAACHSRVNSAGNVGGHGYCPVGLTGTLPPLTLPVLPAETATTPKPVPMAP